MDTLDQITKKERVEFWMPFQGIVELTVHRLKDKVVVGKFKFESGAGNRHYDIDVSGYEEGNYSCSLDAEGYELLVGTVQNIKKFLKTFTVGEAASSIE